MNARWLLRAALGSAVLTAVAAILALLASGQAPLNGWTVAAMLGATATVLLVASTDEQLDHDEDTH